MKRKVRYFSVNDVLDQIAEAERLRDLEAEHKMERDLQRMLEENYDYACDTHQSGDRAVNKDTDKNGQPTRTASRDAQP